MTLQRLAEHRCSDRYFENILSQKLLGDFILSQQIQKIGLKLKLKRKNTFDTENLYYLFLHAYACTLKIYIVYS